MGELFSSEVKPWEIVGDNLIVVAVVIMVYYLYI